MVVARKALVVKALSSHALQDLDEICFDNDLQDWNGSQQLPSGLDGHFTAVDHTPLSAAAAADVGKQQRLDDIPLPPPERPLKWNTKLADRATAAVNLEAHYNMPPHLLFELLADPTQHDRIFDAILAADAELLEESGPCRKWRLDYTARWNFWKVSGVCENRLLMWTDSDAGTVTFKLREPGFLKRYEGTWTIKAACGSPLAAFNAPAGSPAASPASSMFDLVSSSSSGGSSSSRSSSRSSSPRSPRSPSWADGVPSADIFGGDSALSRGGSNGSGTSGTSSISLRTLPLATVTAAAAPAGLTQALSQAAFNAVSALGATVSGLSSTMYRWWAPQHSGTALSTSGTVPAAPTASSSDTNSWPPLFKSSSPRHNSHPLSDCSSSSTSGDAGVPPAQQRPMPTSAVITVASLTSPKLTPPYPLNQCLKVQSKGQVEEMLEGLVKAAAAHLQTQPLQGV